MKFRVHLLEMKSLVWQRRLNLLKRSFSQHTFFIFFSIDSSSYTYVLFFCYENISFVPFVGRRAQHLIVFFYIFSNDVLKRGKKKKKSMAVGGSEKKTVRWGPNER